MEKKLEVNLEELRKRHLFIATPAYGGGMHSSYVMSLIQLNSMLMSYGIPHSTQFMFNESLISRARNKLVDLFLASDATEMLFIDADVEFNPQDVIVLMHMNKDIIGGAYPLKTFRWDNIKKAVLKNPDIDPAELPKQGAVFSTHPLGSRMDMGTFEPVEVKELATGFMLIKREVFEKMSPEMPDYAPASNEVSPHERVKDFFYVGVDPKEDRYVSEDYSFCCKWRDLGGHIYLCPWMKLTHYGSYGFEGNLISVANNLGEIH